MPDISALSNLSTRALALSNLILVRPQQNIGYQPQNPPNRDGTPSTAQPPPTLLFNFEGEQTALLEADITDHYVEDNTAINDQIALRPEIITTNGFIGELNDVVPKALAPLKRAAEKLTVISGYTPSLSQSALIAYNTAFQLYTFSQSARDSAVASWSSLNNTGGESIITGNGLIKQPNQNKQQVFFQQFYGYYKARTLFTVQTPWAIFTNMTIKTCRAIQDADTRVVTDFELTFKIMRFSSTLANNEGVFEGRSALQAGGVTDNGPQTPALSNLAFGDAISGVG